jgi:thymidylate synthase
MYAQIRDILHNGYKDVNPRPKYADGTPAHTISVNHIVRKYDLSKKGEFPICTLRPIAWETAIKEILTIYQKPTNKLSEMEAMGVNWWGDWDIGDGTIGQRYGATVSRYDLINNLIKDIQKDPYGRRKVVSLWQETDLRETAGLAPCAFLTIWNVRNDNDGHEFLDMCLIQRSGDLLTASGPGCINEVQYAALLMMIARHCGYEPGVFTHFIANEQIYDRHLDQARTMLARWGKQTDHFWETRDKDDAVFPMLSLNSEKTNFYDITIDDFEMINYDPIKPQLKLDLGI